MLELKQSNLLAGKKDAIEREIAQYEINLRARLESDKKELKTSLHRELKREKALLERKYEEAVAEMKEEIDRSTKFFEEQEKQVVTAAVAGGATPAVARMDASNGGATVEIRSHVPNVVEPMVAQSQNFAKKRTGSNKSSEQTKDTSLMPIMPRSTLSRVDALSTSSDFESWFSE